LVSKGYVPDHPTESHLMGWFGSKYNTLYSEIRTSGDTYNENVILNVLAVWLERLDSIVANEDKQTTTMFVTDKAVSTEPFGFNNAFVLFANNTI
jgi:hypothetical protein